MGKTEQMALAMKQYILSCVAVTETHLTGAGEMVLDAHTGYTMIFSRRKDACNAEGVGLALTPHARAALRYHQAVSSQILKAVSIPHPIRPIADDCGLCTNGPMQYGRQEPVLCNCVMTTVNGLTMVMGDFILPLVKVYKV